MTGLSKWSVLDDEGLAGSQVRFLARLSDVAFSVAFNRSSRRAFDPQIALVLQG